MPPDTPEVREAPDGAGRTIAGNFQCQLQISQQRNLVVTGYIYSDDTAEEINVRLDMYQDALDRQFVRCDVTNKEAQVQAILAQVEMHRDALEELAAKNTGTGLSTDKQNRSKLTSVERQKLQNGEQTVKSQLAHVDMLRAAIKEGRAKLGMPAA